MDTRLLGVIGIFGCGLCVFVCLCLCVFLCPSVVFISICMCFFVNVCVYVCELIIVFVYYKVFLLLVLGFS